MGLESLILFLYILPGVISLRTFQVSSEYYHQLPDKIPMHFNIRGQADKWLQKSGFSVYFMPAISFSIILMIFGILLTISRESGPLPDDFSLALWFFSFSLAYLFYQTQLGIIQYTLQNIKNIWPAMAKGLSLVAVSTILLVLFSCIPTKPILSEAIMCAKVKSMMPVDERNTFSMNDTSASLFLRLRNIKGKHLIKMVWINPQGREHFVYEDYTHHKTSWL